MCPDPNLKPASPDSPAPAASVRLSPQESPPEMDGLGDAGHRETPSLVRLCSGWCWGEHSSFIMKHHVTYMLYVYIQCSRSVYTSTTANT